MKPIALSEAAISDAEEIRYVQKETWLATYPNPGLGITKEDVAAKIEWEG